jgi:hypothetical protein
MKYTVLEASSIEALEKLVNEFMAKSYKPLGGVCVTGMTTTKKFYQAVAK